MCARLTIHVFPTLLTLPPEAWAGVWSAFCFLFSFLRTNSLCLSSILLPTVSVGFVKFLVILCLVFRSSLVLFQICSVLLFFFFFNSLKISILLFGSLTAGSMGKVSFLSNNSSTEVGEGSFCSHRFLFIRTHLVYFLVRPCCAHSLFVWLCPPQRGASCPRSLKKKKRKWNLIALQSCFSFYCTAKWISSICTHTLSWISCPFKSPQSTD